MIRNQNNHRKILPSVFSVASKFEDPKIPLLHPAYLVSMKQISESKSTGSQAPSEQTPLNPTSLGWIPACKGLLCKSCLDIYIYIYMSFIQFVGKTWRTIIWSHRPSYIYWQSARTNLAFSLWKFPYQKRMGTVSLCDSDVASQQDQQVSSSWTPKIVNTSPFQVFCFLHPM